MGRKTHEKPGHVMQKLVDKFYNGESINLADIGFALGLCAGIMEENKKLSDENYFLRNENDRLQQSAGEATNDSNDEKPHGN